MCFEVDAVVCIKCDEQVAINCCVDELGQINICELGDKIDDIVKHLVADSNCKVISADKECRSKVLVGEVNFCIVRSHCIRARLCKVVPMDEDIVAIHAQNIAEKVNYVETTD